MDNYPFEQPENELTSGDQFMQAILSAQAGDSGALNSLMAQCRNYLMLIANEDMDCGLQGKFGASDFVQQTLLAAHQHIDQFRGHTLEEFKGWLRQILHNDINRVRRQYVDADRRNIDRERRLDDSVAGAPQVADPVMTPSTDAVVREQAHLLQLALAQLPEHYRQVIKLRDWDDQSFPEIGSKMNLSEEAARKLWKRAITRLEEILKPTMDGSQTERTGDGNDSVT